MTTAENEQIVNRQSNIHAKGDGLPESIKLNKPRITGLLAQFEKNEADVIYRYYHQSFKVFGAIEMIQSACQLFEQSAPGSTRLNRWFVSIVNKAVEKKIRRSKDRSDLVR